MEVQPHFRGSTMNRVALIRFAVSALVCIAPLTTAGAADLPTKTSYAAAPVAVSNWTGCYLGLNTGEALANSSMTLNSFGSTVPSINTPLGAASSTGWAYGGQFGCDYQINSNWVIGARGMWDGANVKGNTAGTGPTNLLPDSYSVSSRIDSFATAVGQVGYLLTPTMMIYGLGGVAFGHANYSLVNSANVCICTVGTASEARTGFDVGGGMSWMFDPHWDLFVEYNYMGFGSKNVGFNSSAAPSPFNTNTSVIGINLSEQTILAGVDYRIGGANH